MDTAAADICQAIELREKRGDRGSLMGWNLMYKALVYRDKGDFITANKGAERAEASLLESNLDSKIYAVMIMYRGSILRMLGQKKEAEELLKLALDAANKAPEENILELGLCKNVLSKIYKDTGRLDEALGEAKDAQSLWVSLFGRKNLRTAWIQINLGQIYNAKGDYSEAKKILEESLETHKAMLDESHPKIGKILSELGYAHVKLGNKKEGIAYQEMGIKNLEAFYGKNHPYAKSARKKVGA